MRDTKKNFQTKLFISRRYTNLLLQFYKLACDYFFIKDIFSFIHQKRFYIRDTENMLGYKSVCFKRSTTLVSNIFS